MTLEDVRREMRMRRGGIKGWALQATTFLSITRELGVDGVEPHRSVIPLLFDVPVLLVDSGQPEGVIV